MREGSRSGHGQKAMLQAAAKTARLGARRRGAAAAAAGGGRGVRARGMQAAAAEGKRGRSPTLAGAGGGGKRARGKKKDKKDGQDGKTWWYCPACAQNVRKPQRLALHMAKCCPDAFDKPAWEVRGHPCCCCNSRPGTN